MSTPSGRPASWKSFARKSDALGSFSDGFSTTVLPHAIAEATIHSGTMTGKLNGVIAPTTPTGLLHRVHVDAARDLLGALALQQVHEARGELDVLDAAADLALGVGEDLAVLVREDRGELVLALDEQVAELEEHVGPLDEARGAPSGQRGLRGGDRLVDLGGRGERDLGATSPVAGL